jgi:threonine/homoserine/homoserine lactone efflux protein
LDDQGAAGEIRGVARQAPLIFALKAFAMFDLLPDPPLLAAFLIASVLLGLTPGPDMAVFVSATLKQGRAHGFAALAGVTSGLAVHAALAAAGLSSLLIAAPKVYFALKVAGAVYLLWLAWRIVRSGGGLKLDPSDRRGSLLASYRRALAINLLNPKVIVFFITFLPQFVTADASDPAARLFLLGALFAIINIPVCSGFILAAGAARDWLTGSSRVARVVDWLTAGAFTAFAARLAWSTAR